MFWKNMLKRTDVYNFDDGTTVEPETSEASLNDCFYHVRHLLEFGFLVHFIMGKLTATSVTITEVYNSTHSMSLYRKDKNGLAQSLRPQSVTHTFTGTAADIRPMLEYIFYWHYHESRIAGLDMSVFDASFDLIPKDGSRSYLPALLMGNVATCSLHDFDKKILNAFWKIDAAVIERFSKTQNRQWRAKDYRLWLDFCEVNEMWFNEPNMNLMPLVESLGLLDK